jgi:hypothetical protein
MTSEIEEIGELVWLRKRLSDRSAKQLVQTCKMTTADVGRVIHLSQGQCCQMLNGHSFPRSRDTALRLVRLLEQLAVIRDAS